MTTQWSSRDDDDPVDDACAAGRARASQELVIDPQDCMGTIGDDFREVWFNGCLMIA
jgi:hypothetical protein